MKKMTPFEAMQAGFYLSSALGETALILRNHKISRVRVGDRDYFSKVEAEAWRAQFRVVPPGEVQVRTWAEEKGITVERVRHAEVPMTLRLAGSKSVSSYFAQKEALDAWWMTQRDRPIVRAASPTSSTIERIEQKLDKLIAALGGISDVLTTKEAAAILGVTDERVRQLVAERKLYADRVGAGPRPFYLLRRDEVEALAAERAVTAGEARDKA